MKPKDEIVDPNRIRERIQALIKRSVTQASIARGSGVSPQTLNNFLTGKTTRMHSKTMSGLRDYLERIEATNGGENPGGFNHESSQEASTRLRSYIRRFLLQRLPAKGEFDNFSNELTKLDIELAIRLLSNI